MLDVETMLRVALRQLAGAITDVLRSAVGFGLASAHDRAMSQRYSKEICERDHAGEVPQAVLDSLPENQGHPVRHRCAACAYAAGLNEAADDIKKLVAQVKQLTDENARLKGELSRR